jgi:transaldolase
MKVAVAFDHRGVKLRARVLQTIANLGHEILDLGTDALDPRIDYPDKAREIGEAVRGREAERGVLVCGSGVGASVAACKLPGIRAAVCHDVYSAHQGVEHDNMNVLCLGSEVIGAALAADLIRTFLGAEFQGEERFVRRLRKIEALERNTDMPESNLQKLSALGQSVWIDYLSRDLLETGELARMMREDAVVGVTSNPTIFQKALSQGTRYDAQLKEILESGEDDAKEIFLQFSSDDIAAACDLLRPVWDERQGGDGYVSWEVDPTLAYEREATIAEARRLHAWIERPNLYVKIPATKPGLRAIEEMIAAGRNINVTLTFSLERHKEVMEAYIRGVERLVENGGDPSTVHSVASFFVSRVDTETDKRLDEIGGHDELKGKLGIANAKLAYQNYLETFAGERWIPLEQKGATKQRCLWASTSTKNPEYRDVLYVEELIGLETVNTMPEETIKAFQDHGNVAETLTKDVDLARKLFLDLRGAGIDYADVTETLEREGVQKFSDSFEELMDGIRAKRGELAPA